MYVERRLADLRFADADVAVDSQRDGEPDGRRVEDCRQTVSERHVGGAPAVLHPVSVDRTRSVARKPREKQQPKSRYVHTMNGTMQGCSPEKEVGDA